MLIGPQQGRVVVVHRSDDKLACERIVGPLVEALGDRAVVEVADDAGSVRTLIEREAATGRFAFALVCASDPATATTLIWELAEPGARSALATRTLVVLGTLQRLERLPERLLEPLEFLGVDELGDAWVRAVLDRVVARGRAPRPVDVLASAYRSACMRGSLDGLAAINASVGRVVELDADSLATIARVGDGGPTPNPLWARWIAHGRELKLGQIDERES